MKVLSLHGDHHEMGLQHGKQVRDLRPLILTTMEARLEGLTRRGALNAPLLQDLQRAWEADAQARSTLMMLEGMAQALDIPGERLFQWVAASYLEDAQLTTKEPEGCTVWAAVRSATRKGTPLLAKNRDYHVRHIPLRVIAYAAPPRGYRYIYVTSAGSPGVFSSGMNECGLAIADTHVPSRDIGPGLARFTLMMNMLEQHASVSDAVDYLQSVTGMGAGNLVLTDEHGESAVLESGFRRRGLATPVQDILVATNHFESADLRASYIPVVGAHATGDETYARQATARALLEQAHGGLDVEQAKQIASYHGPTALCRHRPQNAADTISSAIYLPSRRKLLFCNGWPCQGSYETYTL